MALAAAILAIAPGCGCGDDDDDGTAGSAVSGADDDSSFDDDADDDDAADDDATDGEFPDRDLPPPPAPWDPTKPGPYAVGNQTLLLSDPSRYDWPSRGDRLLLTEVWYPAPEFTRAWPRDRVRNFLMGWDDLIRNVLSFILPADEIANFERERGSARHAPIRRDGGPYPLVILSHGNAAIRFASMSLAEWLASHGYVVVAPDHIGNAVFVTLPDRLVIYNPILTPFSFIDRIVDFGFLIETFAAKNDTPGDFFYDTVDAENVGVVGHSYGAVTGTEGSVFDYRIDAVVSMAGFMIPLWAGDFDTPVMFMMGREDKTLGDWNPIVRGIVLPLVPKPRVLVDVFDAGHYTFTDACVLIPTLLGGGDGCGEGTRRFGNEESFDFIDYETSQRFLGTYVTAFMNYTLKGYKDAMRPVLSTNYFPGKMDVVAEFE